MRLLANMVVRNEAARYLDSMLTWLVDIVDDIFILDDRSDDETRSLAESHGARVMPNQVESFLEHEGVCRQYGWLCFEHALRPEVGDWVLAIDADEFLVGPAPVRAAVEEAIERSRGAGIELSVPEIFQASEEGGLLLCPKRRVDGLWAQIRGPRLFAYWEGGRIADKAMGCGSEPTYVAGGPIDRKAGADLALLHLGYADPSDLQAKFERYQGLANHGHLDSHVASIAAVPVLESWVGLFPPIWRGRRDG